MAAAVCVGVILERRLSVANALATAAVVLLAADPLQLFTPGFQLSFTIVTGVVVLFAPIRRLLFRRWLSRRGLADFADARGFRRRVYYGAVDWSISLACVSLAAYISAAPLVAYHFGLFSPYAAPLSMLLLPVVAAVLLPAYLSLGLSWLMPDASWQLGRLAQAAGDVMERLILALRHLPGLSVDVFPLPAGLVILCYAALGAWAAAGRFRRARAPATALSIAAAAWIAWSQLPAAPPEGAALHVLDVGHGAMALLHTSDGATVLFDAGSLNPGSVYQGILRPFLRTARLRSPETVFLSHPNSDHYNAVIEMLGRDPPRRVYLNESFGDEQASDLQLAALMRALARANVEVVRLRAGGKVRLADDAEVEVLWPPGKPEVADLDANNASLVLRVTVRSRRVLLTGDIEEKVQRRLVQTAGDRIAADVLFLPHHGAATWALKDFISAVGAGTLVQSSSWRHDGPELLDAIAGRRRLATFRDGWMRIDLGPDGVKTRTMRSP
jgi:competence protein ComEC